MTKMSIQQLAEEVARALSGPKWQTYREYKDSGIEWLGMVPGHWEVKRMKFCILSMEQGWSPQCENRPAELDEWGVLKVGCVNGAEFNPDENKVLPAEVFPITELEIKSGDILISRANTRELLGSTSIVGQIRSHLLLCDKLYRLKLLDSTINPFYFSFFMLSSIARFQLEREATGASNSMQNISQAAIRDLIVFLPTANEQKTIVNYLNKEIVKISILIAKKEQHIALLQEKRAALISHAVTKGLNAEVPMKDSGVEWLGMVPEHWEVMRVRNIAVSLQTGPFGSQLHSSDYISNGIPVINPSHLKNGAIVPDWDCSVDAETHKRLSYFELLEGDIVFARRGEMGRCALVTENEKGWLCGTGCLRMRIRITSCVPQFLNKMLSTTGVQDWLLLESVGSTMDNLNTNILSRIPLTIPPINEQKAIIAYLDHETQKIDTLISTITNGIKKLQEYRTALISAAVTGKIDVRGVVAEEPGVVEGAAD